MSSAFDSAGQRCSALRILCLQDDVADRMLEMLKGAMAELEVGDPRKLSVDVGPVITAEARDAIMAHIETMWGRGHKVTQTPLGEAAARGTFVAPDPDRSRARSPTSSARCSGRCCTCCATSARRSTR